MTLRNIMDARPDTIRKRFVPQPDITTYELAQIVAKTSHSERPIGYELLFLPEIWAEVPPEIQRHFVDC